MSEENYTNCIRKIVALGASQGAGLAVLGTCCLSRSRARGRGIGWIALMSFAEVERASLFARDKAFFYSRLVGRGAIDPLRHDRRGGRTRCGPLAAGSARFSFAIRDRFRKECENWPILHGAMAISFSLEFSSLRPATGLRLSLMTWRPR